MTRTLNARKARRAELESTWNFWPAERPLTRHDMAAPPPPEAAQAPAAQAEPSVPPDGGTITLTNLDDVCTFEPVSAETVAWLFGLGQGAIDTQVRTPSGDIVTVTGIDRATGTITVRR